MRAAFGAELWDRPGQARRERTLLGPHRLLRVGELRAVWTGLCRPAATPRHTLCPEGNSANLRSRPGLSQQLSQGRDRISGLARDAAHGDARSSKTPHVKGAPARAVRGGSRALGRGVLGLRAEVRREGALRAPRFFLSSLMKDGEACGRWLYEDASKTLTQTGK